MSAPNLCPVCGAPYETAVNKVEWGDVEMIEYQHTNPERVCAVTRKQSGPPHGFGKRDGAGFARYQGGDGE